MKDFTHPPYSGIQAMSFSHLHQHSFCSRDSAVSLGVAGEVSIHHPELVFQWREVIFIGRSEMVVLEHIPPYLALGQPHFIISSVVPSVDNIFRGEIFSEGLTVTWRRSIG